MSARSTRPWSRRLLGLCLLAWPAPARERDGPPLLDAFEDVLASATGGRGHVLRVLAGECASVLGAGLGMRYSALRGRLGGSMMGWMGDVAYALRGFRRSPGFAATVALTLAVGIGANSAVFGVVDEVLFRPAGYDDPEELVFVWGRLAGSPERFRVAAPDAAVLKERATRFQALAFVGPATDGAVEAADGAGAEHVRIAQVTPNLFQLLGVDAALGRVLEARDGAHARPAEDGPQPAPAMVLSYGTWRSVFGGDPAVLGRVVRLDGRAALVVGVLPADFRMAMPPSAGITTDVDAWIPLPAALDGFRRADGRQLDQDSDNTGALIARLLPGMAPEVAAAEVRTIAAHLRQEVQGYAAAGFELDVRPLHADATAHARGLLLALLAAVGVVLMVTCLNISSLLLARGMRRHEEIAVRAALGAGRGRIVRQLFTESLTLVGLGTALAVVVAAGIEPALSALVPPGLASVTDSGLDARVLGFTALVAAVATVVFGLIPALQTARAEGDGALGLAILRGRLDRGRARSALVVAQVALAAVLVLGAGLLVRTVEELRGVRPGFRPAGAMTFSTALRVPGRYRGPGERAALMRELESALRDLPGVTAVGVTAHLPLAGRRWTQPYGLPGQAEAEWPGNRADFRTVTSGYFDALGARMLEGRAFTRDEDVSEERRVVIVDEKLARRIAPTGSAVGARIGFPLDGAAVEAEVVGVVAHIRHETLERDGREGLYVPYRQEASRDVSFVVRVSGEPEILGPAIRRMVREVDAQLPVYGLRTLADYVEAAVAPTRFALAVLTGFALLALLSVGVGLYGVVALEVGRRTRDIGLRMAVGAGRGQVVRSVLWSGVRLGVLGLALGALLAAGAWRGLRVLVFGTTLTDPAVWALVLGVVGAVTLAACWVPARRAAGLDPTVALRAE